MTDQLRVAILGASGYTGGELVRLLSLHPQVRLTALTAERQAGKTLAEVFPHLGYLKLPTLVKIDEVDFSQVDFVFCALPHGTTQQVIAALPQHVRVVDLSADFRLHNLATYAEWYGHEHLAPALQTDAVYGLTEFARGAVGNARLVANPGCYPTSAQLALVPLLESGAIESSDIIIDAKSGVSGAGRDAKQANLFGEVAEGIHAYGVGAHRHAPEIEQGLSAAAGAPIIVNFTPHLMPMSRGILSSCYVKLANGNKPDDLRAVLDKRYEDEKFVHVAAPGVSPATRHVRGSNHTILGVFPDRVPGRAIVLSVLDNLVKGAAGQAVQNMNVMFGWNEATALEQAPLFP
ncbi:N-acetyl-gamma-glutamyl-phosphate reductase [Roseiterribacter gracilis]|uniref:N-acetyl-gamma-glutamyl-phosphate reductase n=1 Tax=Roseiterribacter gracilis TaxID=2812848 RepID=A0A8S8XBH2_9PROT|nr:N-acetyl-gamma-glutamyl-phosphate reductase [Rhodospirillales bacterium TMPK1]